MDNAQIASWRDQTPFDDISRRLLGWLAALTGMASVYAFFWWAASATGFLFFDGWWNTWRGLGTALAFRDAESVVYLFSWVLSVFGGLLVWVSMVGFAVAHRRGWDAVPRWIKAGCLVGALAGLAFEPGRLLALAPIVCAVLMLLRSMLPAHSLQRDPR